MLIDRLSGKIVTFFTDYRYQEDKFRAIGHASRWMGKTERDINTAYAYMKNIEKEANVIIGYYEDRLSEWTKEIWNQLMKELVEDHDYTIAHALEELYHFAKFLKVDENLDPRWDKGKIIGIDKCREKLANALMFKLEFNTEIAGSTNHGPLIFKTKGQFDDIQLTYQDNIYGDKDWIGRATDNVQYEGPTTDGDMKLVLPLEFTTDVELRKLDPCEKQTIYICIGNIAARYEQYTDSGGAPLGLAISSFSDLWASAALVHKGGYIGVLRESDLLYGFTCPLNNLSQNAAHEVFSAADGDVRTTITLTLTHTPEGDLYLK